MEFLPHGCFGWTKPTDKILYHTFSKSTAFFIKQVPKSNRILSEIDADIESSINEIDTLIEELKIKK